MRGLSMGASMLDKLKDAGMTRKSRQSLGSAASGGDRRNSLRDRLMGRSSQRSSFAEIVLKKWTAPREAPRQAMIGEVEGSLRAFDLHVHLLLWRHVSKRGNRIIETVINALHDCDMALRVRRMGLMEGDHTAVLTDPECDATMVCVLDDFDVLLLDQYASTLVEVLKARKDLTNVEQLAKEGARVTLALERPQAARKVTIIFTGHSEDEEATKEDSLYYPYTFACGVPFIRHQSDAPSPRAVAATPSPRGSPRWRAGGRRTLESTRSESRHAPRRRRVALTPSPRRRCAKRREYIADQKTKNTGLHEAVGHVMKLCEKHGAKPPAYVVELLCVQEFQDAQEWKGRGGAGRSRASAASNGDGPSMSLEGAESLQGADAEALAQRILSHQLQADQHSLLCPVTHTHVLWDEAVAAKMYRAAAKD